MLFGAPSKFRRSCVAPASKATAGLYIATLEEFGSDIHINRTSRTDLE